MGTDFATADAVMTRALRGRASALLDRPPPQGPDAVEEERDAGPERAAGPGRRRGRPPWREAVFERLPVWVQVRCGLEPRTVAALAVVLVVALALAAHHFWSGRPPTVRLPPPVPAAGPPAATPRPTATPIAVDVAGKVRRPGVLRLPAGARVVDALQAAGGPLPGTDTGSLNLARILTDGEQVLVGPAAPGPGPDTTAPGTGGPVSLNTATVEQLDALPGVGPVLARHIVEFRTRHGGFTSVEQLHQVTGVGDRRFDDLKSLVRP